MVLHPDEKYFFDLNDLLPQLVAKSNLKLNYLEKKVFFLFFSYFIV